MTEKELASINADLLILFGRGPGGDALWRVVCVDDQFENRLGVFSKWYRNLYLGEERGRKEVLKYSYLPEGSHVIERLVFRPTDSLNIMGSELAIGYEPVGGCIKPTMQDASGIKMIATFVIQSIMDVQKLDPTDPAAMPVGNSSKAEDEFLEKEKQLDAKADDILDDAFSGVPTSTGEAVTVDVNTKEL